MIQHGRHLLIHEMAQESMPQLVGKSVRVVGRLKNIDAESGRVTLEMHGAEVNVDVVQAGQIEMKTSRPMLMFIGELERDTKCRDAVSSAPHGRRRLLGSLPLLTQVGPNAWLQRMT